MTRTVIAIAAKLRQRIIRAQGRWSEASWTHENGTDSDGNPIYCQGGEPDSCALCRDAESDAEDAEDHADHALDLLDDDGDLRAACKAVVAAADLEIEYGDDPTWGAARRVAERVIDELDEVSR